MFLNALDRTRRGVVACVFDTTDRVQHMFFRHQDGDRSTRVIEDLYRRADALVGKDAAPRGRRHRPVRALRSRLRLLPPRRQPQHLAPRNGYLALKDGAAASGPYFEGVDWSRTRAYALGLSGLYLNVKGREAAGIVERAEAGALAAGNRRQALEPARRRARTPRPSARPTSPALSTRAPISTAAPDLIIGYNDGYRTSWDAATGKVGEHVIEDNTKQWSGDHSIDPPLVPGVLFSNRAIDALDPGIEDLAPTALDLFGIATPEWMEGKPVFASAERRGPDRRRRWPPAAVARVPPNFAKS